MTTQELIQREKDYRLNGNISNSDIKNFIEDGIEDFRSKYLNYRNPDRIETPKVGMLPGSVTHSMLVSRDYYDTQYLHSEAKIGGILGEVIETIYSYEKGNFSDELLKKAWLSSSFKAAQEKDEEKREKSFLTFTKSFHEDNRGIKYLHELRDRGDRTIINNDDYFTSIECVKAINCLDFIFNTILFCRFKKVFNRRFCSGL